MPFGELRNGNHQRCHVGTRLPKTLHSNVDMPFSLAGPSLNLDAFLRRVHSHFPSFPPPLSLSLARAHRLEGFPPIFNGTDRTDGLGNTCILQRYAAHFLSFGIFLEYSSRLSECERFLPLIGEFQVDQKSGIRYSPIL